MLSQTMAYVCESRVVADDARDLGCAMVRRHALVGMPGAMANLVLQGAGKGYRWWYA